MPVPSAGTTLTFVVEPYELVLPNWNRAVAATASGFVAFPRSLAETGVIAVAPAVAADCGGADS